MGSDPFSAVDICPLHAVPSTVQGGRDTLSKAPTFPLKSSLSGREKQTAALQRSKHHVQRLHRDTCNGDLKISQEPGGGIFLGATLQCTGEGGLCLDGKKLDLNSRRGTAGRRCQGREGRGQQWAVGPHVQPLGLGNRAQKQDLWKHGRPHHQHGPSSSRHLLLQAAPGSAASSGPCPRGSKGGLRTNCSHTG